MRDRIDRFNKTLVGVKFKKLKIIRLVRRSQRNHQWPEAKFTSKSAKRLILKVSENLSWTRSRVA